LLNALKKRAYARFLSFEWEKKWHPQLADAEVALPHFVQCFGRTAPVDEQIAERLLRLGDVAAALQLSTQAGWNQTEDDWHTLRNLAPESCWVIEMDGKLAATTTLLCYGRRLGWIGMVLTSQEYRRRGLAKRLLTTVLAQADSIGIETLKLDATEQGRPLYEQFGFRSEQEIERWSGRVMARNDCLSVPCRGGMARF